MTKNINYFKNGKILRFPSREPSVRSHSDSSPAKDAGYQSFLSEVELFCCIADDHEYYC